MSVQCLGLTNCFARLEDPRIERTKGHLLGDILTLAVLAVIAGAEGWEDIEDFGRQKHVWLKQYLELPNGIPSHDTIARVFRALRPGEFQGALAEWFDSLPEHLGLRCIPIDGKTLRRSHDRKTMKSALHLVCAWCLENRIVLGQQATDAKSNEITAIPELLKRLELAGAIVTIDAMGCQREIAAQIVDGGGDYLLAVKENQPTLYTAMSDHFMHLHETDFAESDARKWQTNETAHGRHEQRTYYVAALPESMQAFTRSWKKLTSIAQVISRVQHGDGSETSDVRYHISSRPPRVKEYAWSARGHWGIESTLHWTLDMTFREDECRIRKDHGPENFATLRRFVIGVLKQDKTKGSIRKKRKRAAWNNAALLSFIQQAT